MFGKDLASLGQSAFEGCASLREVVFEGGMPEIGEYALPDGVTVSCLEENSDSWEGYPGIVVIEAEEVHMTPSKAVPPLLLLAVAVVVVAVTRHR